MKTKALVLATLLALCTTTALAAPAPSLEKGQTQIDLGAWNVWTNISGTMVDSDTTTTSQNGSIISSSQTTNYTSMTSNSKWNFYGGAQYGLTDKLSLEYAYHGLHGKNDLGLKPTGNEHEVNLIYGLTKNIGVYAGWHRINNSFDVSTTDATNSFSYANNVAQLGLIATAPIAKNTRLYARGAIGTKSTYVWEAGVGIGLGQNTDLNVAWRQVKTKIDADTTSDNETAKYKGLMLGLSYRFGGAAKAAPVIAAPVSEPVAPPAPAPELKDYYLDSIHFDFDVDTPKATEAGKLAHFVQVAKANPNDTFKLVGDTDAKGSDSYNNDLSKRRVMNVAKYATDNGIPAGQLNAAYRGKTDPAESNATDEGRAANRRVDIWWRK